MGCRQAGALHRVDDLVLGGEAGRGLLGNDLALVLDLEDAAMAGDQLGVDPELVLEGGRRTGGPGEIASTGAVGDADHTRSWSRPCPSATVLSSWPGPP